MVCPKIPSKVVAKRTIGRVENLWSVSRPPESAQGSRRELASIGRCRKSPESFAARRGLSSGIQAQAVLGGGLGGPSERAVAA